MESVPADTTVPCFICHQDALVKQKSPASLILFTLDILSSEIKDKNTQGKKFCWTCLSKVEATWNAYREYSRLKSDIQQLYRPAPGGEKRDGDPGSSLTVDDHSEEGTASYNESAELSTRTNPSVENMDMENVNLQNQNGKEQASNSAQVLEGKNDPTPSVNSNTLEQGQKHGHTEDTRNEVPAKKQKLNPTEGDKIDVSETKGGGGPHQPKEDIVDLVNQPESREGEKKVQNKHTCQKCGENFKKEGQLKYHMQTCGLNRIFYCKQCPLTFDRRRQWLRHKKTHQSNWAVSCQVCGQGHHGEAELAAHMVKHAGEKPFGSEEPSVYSLAQISTEEANPNQPMHIRGQEQSIHASTDNTDSEMSTKRNPEEGEKVEGSKMKEENGSKQKEYDITGAVNQSKALEVGKKFNTGVEDSTMPFSCTMCSLKLPTHRDLYRHMRAHKGRQPKTNCMGNAGQNTQHIENIKHMENVDQDPQGETDVEPNTKKLVLCDLCSYVGGSNTQLKEHMQDSHKGEKPFRCEVCGKGFPRKSSLQQHELTHTQQKDHECECGLKFGQKSNLIRHQKTHTGQKDHLCTVCGLGFQRRTELTTHMMKHTGVKPFVCEVCKKTFATKQGRDAHLKIHKGEASHQCEECGKTFNQLSGFIIHRRQHTGERPYKCVTCDAAFALPDSYRSHLLIHTGEKPFKCTNCNAAFRSYPNLQSHIKTHSAEKKYICDHCEMRFAQSSSLNRHLQQHSVPRPFKCDQCDSAYTRAEYLRQHKSRHHEVNVPESVRKDPLSTADGSTYPPVAPSEVSKEIPSTIASPD